MINPLLTFELIVIVTVFWFFVSCLMSCAILISAVIQQGFNWGPVGTM